MTNEAVDNISICYVLLCHKQPEEVIAQIEYLLESGASVVYHMDKGSPKAWHDGIASHFSESDRVITVPPIKAGWGDWSLIKATLRMLNAAVGAFPEATHFYHLSGDCLPIRPVGDLERTLATESKDIIETADFYNDGWIKTGQTVERIEFLHFLNERKYKWWFYRLYDLQRLIGYKRSVPAGLTMSIGSQWWCLRRKTIEKVLDLVASRSDITRFFKRTWIPDEIFFQTMVATLVPVRERVSSPPTFLRFSDYGLPTVFYDDHYDFLTQQDRFFARKVSPNSTKLRKRLIRNFLDKSEDGQVVHVPHSNSDAGINTIGFVVHAGRNGNRFGAQIWEKFSRIDGNMRVYVVVAKKWHVGHRVGQALGEVANVPYVGYIFDEQGFDLANLGGLQNGMNKRRQDPAAFLRTIMEIKNLNEVIIGIDPARYQALLDVQANCADLRVIEVENEFDADYLEGHAERMGIQDAKGASMQKIAMHNTILETLKSESSRLKSIGLKHHEYVRDWHSAKLRADIFARTFERETSDFLNMARHLEIRD